ncbi:YqgQ family protein [Alkalihalophilus pseudofirmus]|uniref:YqgQ family protein n=1 Tax=Alkalihalophilus pseudofirmus TaxID=79885 RepID=UPI00259BDF41|nr:YqgQ family protein [Alkalihalophilus pseudofirmus]WEG18072.1 YqgQ family protein [Alkalihalophilus pseudofirmus]
MNTLFDVMQLLKKYGIFIYTGERAVDLELMEEEVRELYEMKMIEAEKFQKALLLIRREKT